MKRILFSLMTIIAVLCVAGTGSFAYFSDTETSSGNIFTAGTLDMKVGGNDDAEGIYSLHIGPMAPGTAAAYNTWVVTNIGNIAGALTLTVSELTETIGQQTVSGLEADKGTDYLSTQLEVTLFEDVNDNGTCDGSEAPPLYGGLLSGLPGTYNPSDPGTDGSGPVNICLRYQLPDLGDTNNLVQGSSSSFDIKFSLDQK